MTTRHFRSGLAVLICAAFASVGGMSSAAALSFGGGANYGAVKDQGFVVPAVPVNKVPRRFQRQTVSYASDHPAGTIVVDPANHFLYLVESRTKALRYGVSVGTGAFSWSGTAIVAQKKPWPRWTPPKEMVSRSRNLGVYENGLEGGLFNPMGARALYLHEGKRDTLYRIHGTSEWWSIGNDASSGCIRLLNQDVIDLASRVPVGTSVIVLKARSGVRKRM